MTFVMFFALTLVGLGMLSATVRVVRGPTDGDRATSTELVFYCFIAFVVILGLYINLEALFDILLICTVLGFLSALSLTRLLQDGKR